MPADVVRREARGADAAAPPSAGGPGPVAILAPTGQDRTIAARVLARTGLSPRVCADVAALCAAVRGEGGDVGVLLVAEEALAGPARAALLAALAAQPPWGDVPLVVLTGEGELSRALSPALLALTAEANVTLIERPVRVATLVSALRSALRARRRQFDLRDYLAERAQAAAALDAARAQAEAERERATEANQAKSAFLAVMSHELRTPLNAIGGYTQLLDLGLAGPLTEQQREYLERLSASSRHLLGLVNDVLDLSKVEAGEARVAHADAWTGPALSAALDLVRPQAGAKGVRLVDGRADEQGVPFVGDEDRVRQVVLNLVSNAVKFTPPGGAVTVTCDTAAETPPAGARLQGVGPWAYVRVADTGVGIAAEEQARVFEPFQQVEGGTSSYTRTQGGTGLGLAISRRLARLMGGDVTVESAPGAGSAFTLWLPAARRAGGVQAETASARSARAEHDAAPLQPPGLGAVGALLRASVDEILAAYAARLRADPEVPRGRAMRRIQLEDHAVSFCADLAQSLVIVGDAGPEAAELLKDGSAIQRTIAEAHGARRYAQGFDEAALRRDHHVFREEVERAVRGRLGAGGATAAVQVLVRLIDRAEAISVAGWRRAAAAAD